MGEEEILSKNLYKFVFLAIWAIGLLHVFLLGRFFLSAGGEGIGSLRFIIFISLLAGSLVTLFSFFWGAQAGFWLRAVNIILATVLIVKIYDEYTHSTAGDPRGLPVSWLVAIFVIILNVRMAPKLRERFAERGKEDFFDIYFGS